MFLTANESAVWRRDVGACITQTFLGAAAALARGGVRAPIAVRVTCPNNASPSSRSTALENWSAIPPPADVAAADQAVFGGRAPSRGL